MEIKYKPKGVCAAGIILNVEENIVVDARIIGGCPGNGQGVSALVKGLKVDEVIARLEGIRCGQKATSCPDQIAQALKENC